MQTYIYLHKTYCDTDIKYDSRKLNNEKFYKSELNGLLLTFPEYTYLYNNQVYVSQYSYSNLYLYQHNQLNLRSLKKTLQLYIRHIYRIFYEKYTVAFSIYNTFFFFWSTKIPDKKQFKIKYSKVVVNFGFYVPTHLPALLHYRWQTMLLSWHSDGIIK